MARFAYLALFTLLSSVCYGFESAFNESNPLVSGQVSWYGSPTGFGSDGGACGYLKAVGVSPFSSYVGAAPPSKFQSGKGCGVCYQVRCSGKFCSGRPVKFVITDQCPECDSRGLAFDLSGTTFGAMAIPGQEAQLRNVGLQQVQFQRVYCNFGQSIVFRIDQGSTPYYFATAVLYESGLGLKAVELKDASGAWRSMQISFGAVFKVNAPEGLKPPFSIRLTAPSGKQVVANNVIPANFQPGQTYKSNVNF